MILHNLSKAIREQNYYAVFLEFVIVILGVVIGFQITAWNEARQERDAEREILRAFSSELDAITVEASRARSLAEVKRAAAWRFLALEPGEIDGAGLDAALADLLWHQSGTLQTGFVESLLTSSSLALSDAPELRTDLARWPDRLSRFRFLQQSDFQRWRDRLNPYLLENAELERIAARLRSMDGAINTSDSYRPQLSALPPASLDHTALMTDPAFRGLVVTTIWDQVNIVQEADRIEAAATHTRSLIAARLGESP